MSKKKLVGITVACIIGILVVLGIVASPSGLIPASLFSKPTPAPAPTSTPISTPKTHIYRQGAILVGGDGEPIELINNPDATNPTYAELLAFIKKDRTDEYSYIFGPPKIAYVCADFAETVHNNAEAAGLKAAWVGIDIYGDDEGHALNAFQTTDIGLVYIDCTGKGLWSESPNRSSWDRRARVEIGKPYAVADISKAKSHFEFFVSMPVGSDQPPETWGGIDQKLEEGTLKRLEALGWIRLDTYEKREQRSLEQLKWLRTHDIIVLGQRWMQEWIREHEAELSRCGREFKPEGGSRGSISWGYGSESHVGSEGWYMFVDCLETPWFQPEEELRGVDGVPIVWKVSWEMGGSWTKQLGIVKDIHW